VADVVVELPTLKRICEKYRKLFYAYKCGKGYALYVGTAFVGVDNIEGTFVLTAQLRLFDLSDLESNEILVAVCAFGALAIELKNHEKEILEEAEVLLKDVEAEEEIPV
jgi:hypothetical protein